MSCKGDFVAGVIVGAAVGAIAGVLFAPVSGEETRACIAEKGEEIKELAAEMAEKGKEKSDEITNLSKDLIAKLRDRLPKTEEVQDVLDQAVQELSGD